MSLLFKLHQVDSYKKMIRIVATKVKMHKI